MSAITIINWDCSEVLANSISKKMKDPYTEKKNHAVADDTTI